MTIADHPLDDHPHFSRWDDPETGVPSYVLSTHLAPLQKAFYFQTPSIKAASEYLWFRALTPPGDAWVLGVVCLDPANPDIRLFPGAQIAGNPWVEVDGTSCVVPVGDGLYRFHPDGSHEEIFRFPEDVRQNRYLFELTTTLDVTCDLKKYVLSSRVGSRWIIGTVDRASGDYTRVDEFSTAHIHAFCSPVDPNLICVNQNHWLDPITGLKSSMNVRMWFLTLDGARYEPVYGDLCFNRNAMGCHEWFGPDGSLYWCDYREGIWKSSTGQNRTRELFWDRPSWHGQTDPVSGRYLTADVRPYTWDPCQVFLYDSTLKKDIAIASDLPRLAVPRRDWRAWHMDPHPCFSEDAAYITYTTTVFDALSVAVCPVQSATEKLGHQS